MNFKHFIHQSTHITIIWFYNKFWFVSTLVAINLFQTFPNTDSFLYYYVSFSLSNKQLCEGQILISLPAVTG